ncbi:MAG: cyclic nucleotide-binding domain-containing protein, partial [Ghiorsea sp.]|nr:cyclic nucleotide-binding domain-containing protein [Ghiorsea sp.]
RGVNQVDLTALRLIEHMNGMMHDQSGELILAHVPKSMGLVKREGHRHERLVPYHQKTRLRTFADSDRALEYAESELLKGLCGTVTGQDHALSLDQAELMSVFNAKEKDILRPFFKMREIKKGEFIFHSGDFGEELFVILRGEIEVLLPYTKKRKLRLASFGPGMTVGEIAFLEPSERSADAHVTVSGEVAVFQHKALKKLCVKYPDLGMRVLMRLGHDMSENLRMADAELRRLAS